MFYDLFLFYSEAIHKPPVLLQSYPIYLFRTSWPLKSSIYKSLIKKYMTIAFKDYRFNPVSSSAAKKIDTILIIRIKIEIIFYDSNQTIDTTPKICIASRYIYVTIGGIIKHLIPPPKPLSEAP